MTDRQTRYEAARENPRWSRIMDGLFEATVEPDGFHNTQGHVMITETYPWYEVVVDMLVKNP